MTNNERRDLNLPYITDDSVLNEQKTARRLTQILNTTDRSDFDAIKNIVKELFGKSENAFVNPPFYCDYGKNIEVGKNFYANYNCTILDVAKVMIGDNCMLAPNVAIYTAGHPVHPLTRNTLYEYGIEITIGDNVWIGGNTVICPGAHIGSNTVIGAGSFLFLRLFGPVPADQLVQGEVVKIRQGNEGGHLWFPLPTFVSLIGPPADTNERGKFRLLQPSLFAQF